MSLNGSAYIVGAYEHPTRKADDLSTDRHVVLLSEWLSRTEAARWRVAHGPETHKLKRRRAAVGNTTPFQLATMRARRALSAAHGSE